MIKNVKSNPLFHIGDAVVFIGEDTEIEKGTIGIIDDIDDIMSFSVRWFLNNGENMVKVIDELCKEKTGYIPKTQTTALATFENLLKLDLQGMKNILSYNGYYAKVYFTKNENNSTLQGLLLDTDLEYDDCVFEIKEPASAQTYFEELVDSLISSGKLK